MMSIKEQNNGPVKKYNLYAHCCDVVHNLKFGIRVKLFGGVHILLFRYYTRLLSLLPSSMYVHKPQGYEHVLLLLLRQSAIIVTRTALFLHYTSKLNLLNIVLYRSLMVENNKIKAHCQL